MPENRPLRVFLCHSSNDKPAVRELYQRLSAEGWMDVWLDEEKLYPGQDWDLEIEKAVEATDVVIVCLSSNSVSKEGYVQRELRFVLRIADYKPEGAIFVVPVRLNDCPMPRRLAMWQYTDLFPDNRKDWAYKRLLGSLQMRAKNLGISTVNPAEEKKHQEEIERKKAEDAERKRKKDEAEKAKLEEEKRIRKEVEEQKRKLADEEARRKREERKQNIPARRQTNEIPSSSEINKIQDAIPSPRKSNTLNLLGGWGIILLCIVSGIFGIGYFLRNGFSNFLPTPFATEAPISRVDIATATDAPITEEPTSSTGKDGMTLLYVPAGDFTMGNDADDALAECQKFRDICQRDWFVDEEPPHTVSLDAFWIDQTEVTNAMYAKCVDDGACDPPSSIKSDTRDSYFGNSEFDEYPVIYVSWNNANDYCSWADRRLPTEAE